MFIIDNVTIYKCKDGRTRAYLKDDKKVISYPRYILEKHLGRELDCNEQVHHKDGNPLNNELDNLEIRMLGEHQKEHSTKYFDKVVVCQWCGEPFLWTAKQQRNFYRARNKVGRAKTPFCSKKCVGEYGKLIQTLIS